MSLCKFEGVRVWMFFATSTEDGLRKHHGPCDKGVRDVLFGETS